MRRSDHRERLPAAMLGGFFIATEISSYEIDRPVEKKYLHFLLAHQQDGRQNH